ncbi:amino acid transporter [Francisella tularensis subsp. novicida]|uniref:amino acid permease n=1 Tax=Francisella tularensis TaxID=263 RepID=UPI000158B100|nr:aromatic amino acid transport family protein [Francisella tularensis]AEE88137.1 Tyrosine-specific transport protein [Francisella cf. novicida Fx1]AJI44576.1 tryptophan/tyrosine permease family protein [Francisella tularensis subsp. novicida F6168]AJI72785.1 tryptophan/tyrosine permease family protein [Francisella tularensis subsp. novicida D9876]AJJ47458.1 tryptophan/tyrosine permease family protein [Francisella tularensis subsp. novicida]APC99765.1 tryptophan/tyrosine permease family prote
MNSRSIGSVFLIIGTTIGAGMLSLPLIVASCGFSMAIILLILSWSVMYITALKLLRVCAKYPLGVNFTSMMQSQVSRGYLLFFSIIYLLLLYSLMSAYTTQGSSLVSAITSLDNSNKAQVGLSATVFTIIFGALMFSYKVSDYANRFFVIVKFLFFAIAVVIMLFYIDPSYLSRAPLSLSAFIFAWPTLLPSFGFHNIIPVIYEYQKGDINKIKKSILIGSLSVLVIYIIWIFLALALIPQQGLHSYQTLFSSGNNTPAGLAAEIREVSGSGLLEIGLNTFIHIAIITSFIGVGISLMHYIRDLFTRYHRQIGNLALGLICFIPPLIFTIFYPRGFILALQYAAIFAVIIFVYTPSFLSRKADLKVYYSNLYVISMGSVVILFQIFNLCFNINPFSGF